MCRPIVAHGKPRHISMLVEPHVSWKMLCCRARRHKQCSSGAPLTFVAWLVTEEDPAISEGTSDRVFRRSETQYNDSGWDCNQGHRLSCRGKFLACQVTFNCASQKPMAHDLQNFFVEGEPSPDTCCNLMPASSAMYLLSVPDATTSCDFTA